MIQGFLFALKEEVFQLHFFEEDVPVADASTVLSTKLLTYFQPMFHFYAP